MNSNNISSIINDYVTIQSGDRTKEATIKDAEKVLSSSILGWLFTRLKETYLGGPKLTKKEAQQVIVKALESNKESLDKILNKYESFNVDDYKAVSGKQKKEVKEVYMLVETLSKIDVLSDNLKPLIDKTERVRKALWDARADFIEEELMRMPAPFEFPSSHTSDVVVSRPSKVKIQASDNKRLLGSADELIKVQSNFPKDLADIETVLSSKQENVDFSEELQLISTLKEGSHSLEEELKKCIIITKNDKGELVEGEMDFKRLDELFRSEKSQKYFEALQIYITNYNSLLGKLTNKKLKLQLDKLMQTVKNDKSSMIMSELVKPPQIYTRYTILMRGLAESSGNTDANRTLAFLTAVTKYGNTLEKVKYLADLSQELKSSPTKKLMISRYNKLIVKDDQDSQITDKQKSEAKERVQKEIDEAKSGVQEAYDEGLIKNKTKKKLLKELRKTERSLIS